MWRRAFIRSLSPTRLAMAAALCALSALVAVPAPAAAQGIDLFGFLRPPGSIPAPSPNRRGWQPPSLFNFGAPQPQPPVEPPPPVRKVEPEGVVYDSVDAATKGRRQPPTKFVLVLGDRIGGQLAQGLADATLADRATTAVIARTPDEAGFMAQPVDWMATGAEAVAAVRPQATVLALGWDDLQPIKDGERFAEPLTERWLELYSRRVDEVLAALRDKTGGRLILMGLAPAADAKLSADYERLNEVLRARAARAGIPFANIWDGFTDDEGKYMASGPAVDGQRRRLRFNDGVRFARAGSRKLAFFVQKDLNRFLAEPAPAGAEDSAPAANPAVARTLAGAPAAAATPAAVRPAAASRALREGVPLDPVRGRADDFSWPPPAEPAPR